MTDKHTEHRWVEWAAGTTILLLFAAMSIVGITWGLPSRKIDKYLFADAEPWSGEKIYRLAGAGEKFSPCRGADVDADPLDRSSGEPIHLTSSDEDVARIYLRYRLFTYQPDEMITMMALAQMSPRTLHFDPQLYQYGGLFIYPVGALIGSCGLAGLIDVRSDVAYYLDDPEEFGKFYIVARAYAAAWGLMGALIVYAIARRLGGSRAGWLAALLFTLMPVVVCMAHEGKPHLPGAVLMLTAVLCAMRHLNQRAAGLSPRGQTDVGGASLPQEHPRGLKPAARPVGDRSGSAGRDWWLMCVCCGAAFGMVLSSLPIFVLIPVVAWRAAGFSLRGQTDSAEASLQAGTPRGRKPAARDRLASALKRMCLGVLVAIAVYLAANPYIIINAIANRDVLESNFGNSLAMYEITRIGEGLVRVLELTIEGATLPILLLGVMAMIVAIIRRNGLILALAVPAVVFFLQFVLIGAGKPGEYGRFGIFTNTALAIGTACLLTRRWTKLREVVNWIPASVVVIWVALFGASYLRNFYIDTTEDCSRIRMARTYSLGVGKASMGPGKVAFAVLADPAPYSFPPIDFSLTDILVFRSRDQLEEHRGDRAPVPIIPLDQRAASDPGFAPFPQPQQHGGRSRTLIEQIWSRDTPISWANKSFHGG